MQMRRFALALLGLVSTHTVLAQSTPAQRSFLHIEVAPHVGGFVSNDQRSFLGFNAVAAGLAGAFAYRFPQVPLRLGVRATGYVAPRADGAVGALFSGELSLGTDIDLASSVRVPIHLAGGVGWTGGITLPVASASTGIETRIGSECWLGLRVLYHQAFQNDGGNYSDDAMLLALAVSVVVEPLPGPPELPPVVHVHEHRTHQTITLAERPAHAPLPAPTPAELENSRALLELALSAMPNSSEVRILPPVLFDFDSATLSSADEVALLEALRIIEDELVHPENLVIDVEGFADPDGADEHNDTLANQRAQVVFAWLAAHGVAQEMLHVRSYGESRPLAHSDAARGNEMSRRVILRVVRGAP